MKNCCTSWERTKMMDLVFKKIILKHPNLSDPWKPAGITAVAMETRRQ